MLSLIAHLDGVNAQLFHIEHCGNQTAWKYRVMGPDGVWMQPVRAAGESAVFALPHATNEVKAEWRMVGGQGSEVGGQEEEDAAWIPAMPHIYGPAECEFTVALSRVDLDPRYFKALKICSVVRGHPSAWELTFPEEAACMTEPGVFKVRGVSVCPGLGQVLREAAEFQQGDGIVSVINAGASQAALLPVDAAIPGVLPYTGAFLVKTGRLSDEEVELLKQEVASWPV